MVARIHSVAHIISPESAMIKRRVEIISFKQERITRRPLSTLCPVCQNSTELLTTFQAGALVQVRAESIRRWLAHGRAHGVKTPGGHHRICRHSLFHLAAPPMPAAKTGVDNEPSQGAAQLIIAENRVS